MLEIKNLLFQPLTLHLADSNKSIHLAARGKAVIKDKDLSREIRKAQAKGWISLKAVNSQQSEVAGQKITTNPKLPTNDGRQPTKNRRAKS
jgi:DNA-binding protein